MFDRNETRAGVVSSIAAGILVVALSVMAFVAFDASPQREQVAFDSSATVLQN